MKCILITMQYVTVTLYYATYSAYTPSAHKPKRKNSSNSMYTVFPECILSILNSELVIIEKMHVSPKL